MKRAATVLLGAVLLVTGCSQDTSSTGSLPAAASASSPAAGAASAGSTAPSAAPTTSDAPASAPSAGTAQASTARGADPVPSGGPIATVDDYRLPAGLGVWSFPEGSTSFVFDDLTPDIYFNGTPVDQNGEQTSQAGAEAIYRYDTATRQATKVAERSRATPGVEFAGVFVTSATNGWFFWEEQEITKPDTKGEKVMTRVCFAAKSDGTQVTKLTEVTSPIPVEGIGDHWYHCGLNSGGGTMLWWGRHDNVMTANVFDTRTAQSKVLLDQAPNDSGAVYGDTVLIEPDVNQKSTTAILIQISTGKQTTWKVPAGANSFGLSSKTLSWVTSRDAGAVVMGCPIDVSNPAVCPNPVKLGNSGSTGESDGPGIVSLLDSNAVVRQPEPKPQVIVSLANPADKAELLDGIEYSSVGANRLGGIWVAKRGSDGSSATPRTSIYLRVITLK